MTLTRLDDASRFLEALPQFSCEREAELNLMLGLAEMRRGDLGDAFLAVLGREVPRAAVMRTPPSGLVIAELVPGSSAELAEALLEVEEVRDAPVVAGTTPTSRAFAERWLSGAGREPELDMAQHIYSLTSVTAPETPAPGEMRQAIEADLDLIVPWVASFEAMVLGKDVAQDAARRRTEHRIRNGALFVWDAGDCAVSMAALARPTARGIAVNLVYTPPELRKRGYASACVAALSQHALDSGREFACLFTDAANPTSNAIYQRIGYRLVCNVEIWSL